MTVFMVYRTYVLYTKVASHFTRSNAIASMSSGRVKGLMRENIVRGPWTRRMSLDDFYYRADQYLAVITAKQKLLASTYKLLRAEKDIHLCYQHMPLPRKPSQQE